MLYTELLEYLADQGDDLVSQTDDEIVTERGERYVRSREGYSLGNNQWRTIFVWSRW